MDLDQSLDHFLIVSSYEVGALLPNGDLAPEIQQTLARDTDVLYAFKSSFFARKDLSMSDVKAVKHSFVELPAARLYYETSGEGDPVILLHGGLLDGRMWDHKYELVEELRRRRSA